MRKLPNDPVPLHLRNAVTNLMRDLDYGAGYRYSHEYPGHFTEQEYLPPALKDRRYYQASGEGKEQEIGERMKQWWGGDPQSS